MKPAIYAKTPAKHNAIMHLIESRFAPPFYETPTTAEIAQSIGLSEKQTLRHIRTLVKLGRLLRSDTGKVVPALIWATHDNPNIQKALNWNFNHSVAGEKIRQEIREFTHLDYKTDRIEDGTGPEWLNLRETILSMLPPVQTPPETPADQPPPDRSD